MALRAYWIQFKGFEAVNCFGLAQYIEVVIGL